MNLNDDLNDNEFDNNTKVARGQLIEQILLELYI